MCDLLDTFVHFQRLCRTFLYAALVITNGKRQLPSILSSKRKSLTANFCCQSFIYNLLWTFLYLLNKIFSFIQMFTLLRKDSSPDYFTQSISFPFILGFNMLRWSKQYANIGLYYALCRRAQFTIYFIFFKKVYTSFYNLCIYILSKRFKLIT